ncbi:GNAT family N-acetyltransferase [Fibrella sp. HMF5335]|uniref:GNAT family N-acetyltransferase n=1 Tax=Fibrella rubiginis TaxID=2817060 RepID=A0A939GJ18_9BACT|nr:GNAT family N-acetyltransferase [Fibrella rubiginis]MBO0937337.1 GNAT family N-acetyltransferase [Fibrella rubiginis]
MIQENIANLTSLWQTVGQSVNAYLSTPEFDICMVNNAEWPNRLWFRGDHNEAQVKLALEQVKAASVKLIVPYWDIYNSGSQSLLERAGFKRISEQAGMGMDLHHPLKQTQPIRLETVRTKAMAVEWEALFSQAFGYRITADLLLPTYPTTAFFLVYLNNTPIGTCALHHTNGSIIGIHSVGIIPTMRAKGLARQTMITVLNQAMAEGFTYAVLQASAMGKGLYLTLGFSEQFVQVNYSLPPDA